MEEEVEKRKLKLKKLFFGWIKDNYDKAFLAVFLLAVAIRLYFLVTTLNQPVWWDAADYLTEAKVLAGKLDIAYYFTPRRTFLLPLLWAGLLKLGFGEVSFRILEFLFSVAMIPAVYMVGKKIFDKKIGLISSFLFAVFWLQIFYSNRLMTEIPSLTLLLFSVYFFWEAYTKKNEKIYIWFGVFLGLSFLIRAGTLVMFAVFPIFLLLTEKFKFFKNKYLWLGVLCIFILMASFFIFTSIKQNVNAFSYFLALTPETATEGTARFSDMMGLSGITEYAKIMPHYLANNIVPLFLFIFGILFSLFNLFIRIGFAKKSPEEGKYLFILLLALVPFLFQAIVYNHVEDRYLMNAFPALFIMFSLGLVQIGKWLNNYKKYFGTFIVIILLIFCAYFQISYGNLMMTAKATSYQEVKDSALWIKANSQSTDKIFTVSIPQTTYYAEREAYSAAVSADSNQSYFEEQVKKLKPTFLVLSLFESYAPWTYSYPQNHTSLLTPVKGYGQDNNPVLIIYKFNYNETIS
jgi:4-amino-4-deoxy-L-arabinose transferase-like glycosyltransferase